MGKKKKGKLSKSALLHRKAALLEILKTKLTPIDKNLGEDVKVAIKKDDKKNSILDVVVKNSTPILRSKYYGINLNNDVDSKFVRNNKNKFSFIPVFKNLRWIFSIFFITFGLLPELIRKLLIYKFSFVRVFLLLRFNIWLFNLNILLTNMQVINNPSDVLFNFKAFCSFEMFTLENIEKLDALKFFNYKKKFFVLFHFYNLFVDTWSFFLIRYALEFVKAITYNEYIGTHLFFFPELRTSLIKTFNQNRRINRPLMSSQYILEPYAMSLYYNNFVLLGFSSKLQKYKDLKRLFIYITIRSPLLRILNPATVSKPLHYRLKTLRHIGILSIVLHFLHVLQTNPKKFFVAKFKYLSVWQIFSGLLGTEGEMHRLLESYINSWESNFFNFVFSEISIENLYFLSSFKVTLFETRKEWSLFDLFFERFKSITAKYYVNRGLSKLWLFKNYDSIKDVSLDLDFLKKKEENYNDDVFYNQDSNYWIEEEIRKTNNFSKKQKTINLKTKLKVLKQGLKMVKNNIKLITREISLIKKEDLFSYKRNRVAGLKKDMILILNDRKIGLKEVFFNLKTKFNIVYLKLIHLQWEALEGYDFIWSSIDSEISNRKTNSLYNKLVGVDELNLGTRKFLGYRLGVDFDKVNMNSFLTFSDFDWNTFNYLLHLFQAWAFDKTYYLIDANFFIFANKTLAAEPTDNSLYFPFMLYLNWDVLSIDDVKNFFYFNLDFISNLDRIIMDSFFLTRFINLRETFNLYFETISPTIRKNMPIGIFSYIFIRNICLKIFLSSNNFALFFLFLEWKGSGFNLFSSLFTIISKNDLGYIKIFLAQFYYVTHTHFGKDVKLEEYLREEYEYKVKYKSNNKKPVSGGLQSSIVHR